VEVFKVNKFSLNERESDLLCDRRHDKRMMDKRMMDKRMMDKRMMDKRMMDDD
jgi:hypothetical protein